MTEPDDIDHFLDQKISEKMKEKSKKTGDANSSEEGDYSHVSVTE